jgi:molecular chaperone DnaK (HSP70)
VSARFIVGIDLGTTNSAVAYVDSADPDPPGPSVKHFAIPQIVQPTMVEPRPTLPSFLYLAGSSEFADNAFALPWSNERFTAGEFARTHGWQVPRRLVSSAKSWLGHAGVDRTAPILPWQAPAEVDKISPLTASARYLGHLRAAWDTAHPDAPLAAQDVLLTVPASFDAAARELTVRAATEAGLPQVTLLEEPQAAFYSWLAARGDQFRRDLKVGDTVLVCDVGGGTTDFSLIAVSEAAGSLALERVAVGDHILLGGDNMDLLLAIELRARLAESGTTLDEWQFSSLVHSVRAAKELLLSGLDKEAVPVMILGRGSKVIGGSVRTELKRADVERLLVEGFFPHCEPDAKPARAVRSGLRELGLPFAQDAAVTRHLAQFLARHRQPTAILFNGGVMKAPLLQNRVAEVVGGWSPGLRVLAGTDLDLAVALGAAYYGLVRRGRGVRIRGGTARAYYVGIESSMPAVPGFAPPLKALCVAPFGMEEGAEVNVADRELGVIVGEPVEFRFLSSSVRKDDKVGTLVDVSGDIVELEPVSIELPGEAGATVAVTLRAKVTEIGTLELWCDETGTDRKFKLEYNVRESQTA